MNDIELLFEQLERLAIVLDEFMPECARLVRYAQKQLKEKQQVVRCKDCKHKEESVSPSWEAWCNRLHCGCDLDWFCADGERAE